MITSEIQANPDLSHRIARVSRIMVLQLGMTPHDMFQLAKLVHHVELYEDLPEYFRIAVEEAEKIAEG